MWSKLLRVSKVEKIWCDEVRELGSIISGKHPVEIHHCAGRAAKHNKIHVGIFWILPLTKAEHDSVPTWAHGRKEREKWLFARLILKYRRVYGRDIPFDECVAKAIQDYHK